MSTHISVPNPTGRLVAEHPGAVRLGRAGWAAKGVVYTITGVLAATVVLTSFGWSSATANQEASPTGAIKTIAASPGGAVLLWLLALSMLLYTGVAGDVGIVAGAFAEAWAKRIGYLVSAVIYTTFTLTTLTLTAVRQRLRSGGERQLQGDQPDGAHDGQRHRPLAHRSDRGARDRSQEYRLVKGGRLNVEEELDLSGMSHERILWTRRLGAVGEIGRGYAITVIGIFLVRAAVQFDPKEATGLDGAFSQVGNADLGRARG